MRKADSDGAGWSGRGRGWRSGRVRGRFRPVLLELEDRRLPSTSTVSSTADDGGSGTLRSAVLAADSTGGSNTIQFAPAVFGVSRTIVLSEGALVLTSGSITIDGPGAGLLTVEGAGSSR